VLNNLLEILFWLFWRETAQQRHPETNGLMEQTQAYLLSQSSFDEMIARVY
jgi:hypothetical protein